MTKVSFIVLTYNSSKHIGKLLDSLYKKFEKEIAEIGEVILVDNNSNDTTIDVVKKRKDVNLRIVEADRNLGFAAGINLGVKHAAGNYLIFINPDSEYLDGNIFDAISAFEKDEKLGIIGGAIKSYQGGPEKSCGKFLKTFEILLLILGLDEFFGIRFAPQKKAEVDFVSGGFMLISKKTFEMVRGFDEDFFMYVEDMELCYRVKKIGYKIIFSPEISIMHEGQGSSSRAFAIRNIFQGLLLFHKKHGSPISYFLVKPMLKTKASLLVYLGKMLNNKYLVETYKKAI